MALSQSPKFTNTYPRNFFEAKLTPGFSDALNTYRERLAAADAKERQTRDFYLDANFKYLRFTQFEKALVFYTATLLYTGETDALLASMYGQLDEIIEHTAFIEYTFAANPDIVANRHVLHFDPRELVTPLFNQEAHYLLDANQLLVIKTYDEIFSVFKAVNGFQNLTPIILAYLAHAFYLPAEESRSREAKEAAYRERLLAREEEVKAYDHLLAPFHEARKEDVIALFERALLNYDECHEQVVLRLREVRSDEIERVKAWGEKFIAENADTTSINKLKMKACIYLVNVFGGDDAFYPDAFACMQLLVKLKCGIENCSFVETVMYYMSAIGSSTNSTETEKLKAKCILYLEEKIAAGNIQASGYLGYLLSENPFYLAENTPTIIEHLKKAQHICVSTLDIMHQIIKTQCYKQNKNVKHHMMECLTRSVRNGYPLPLRTLGGRPVLTDPHVTSKTNPTILAEAARFCASTAHGQAEERLKYAMERGHFVSGEFAETMWFYEQAIARNYRPFNHNNQLSYLSETRLDTNGETQKIKALFETLSVAEKVKMLYVGIRFSQEMTFVQDVFIARMNSLAREDGALDLLEDPMKVEYLDQVVLDKFAARKVQR